MDIGIHMARVGEDKCKERTSSVQLGEEWDADSGSQMPWGLPETPVRRSEDLPAPGGGFLAICISEMGAGKEILLGSYTIISASLPLKTLNMG